MVLTGKEAQSWVSLIFKMFSIFTCLFANTPGPLSGQSCNLHVQVQNTLCTSTLHFFSKMMRAMKIIAVVFLFALLHIVSAEEEKNFYFNKFMVVSYSVYLPSWNLLNFSDYSDFCEQ